MRALNIRTGKELSHHLTVADNLLKRMRGLLGKNEMHIGEALWISPCMSIHTFLMKFPIDVAFLDKRNKVIATIKGLKPNRITRLYFCAVSVIEMPAGTIEATSTAVGDEIEIV
jgi:uncharacterized membrane protein (UPF0127 family)